MCSGPRWYCGHAKMEEGRVCQTEGIWLWQYLGMHYEKQLY